MDPFAQGPYVYKSDFERRVPATRTPEQEQHARRVFHEARQMSHQVKLWTENLRSYLFEQLGKIKVLDGDHGRLQKMLGDLETAKNALFWSQHYLAAAGTDAVSTELKDSPFPLPVEPLNKNSYFNYREVLGHRAEAHAAMQAHAQQQQQTDVQSRPAARRHPPQTSSGTARRVPAPSATVSASEASQAGAVGPVAGPSRPQVGTRQVLTTSATVSAPETSQAGTVEHVASTSTSTSTALDTAIGTADSSTGTATSSDEVAPVPQSAEPAAVDRAVETHSDTQTVDQHAPGHTHTAPHTDTCTAPPGPSRCRNMHAARTQPYTRRPARTPPPPTLQQPDASEGRYNLRTRRAPPARFGYRQGFVAVW